MIYSHICLPAEDIPPSYYEAMKYYWMGGRDLPLDVKNLGSEPVEFVYPSKGWTFKVSWSGDLLGENSYIVWLNNKLVQEFPTRSDLEKKVTGVQKSTHQVFDEAAFL